jgi:hypothetical protein
VAGGRYVFSNGADSSVAQAVQQKRQQDEVQVAALVAKGTPAIKLIYDDGDSHASFKRTLVAGGSDSLNRTATWASRDVGVSRPDAITGGPRVLVLDNLGKPKAEFRAASADNDAVLAAVAAAPEVNQVETASIAKPSPAKVEAQPRAVTGKPASAAATQVAKATAGAAAAPVAIDAPSLAPTAAAPAAVPFYQRALSFVPLIGGSQQQPEQAQETTPVASVVPDSPTNIRAPLPPRRATGLRTSRLDQSDAAYSSQPVTR